jgi:lycopene cyclase domain-containing protein
MADTYGRVLLFFTVLPIAALGVVLARQRRLARAHLASLAVLLLVVYAATAPWDNAAVARGYWAFDRARTWGVWIARLPAEEYLFFGLQSVLAALVLFTLLSPNAHRDA